MTNKMRMTKMIGRKESTKKSIHIRLNAKKVMHYRPRTLNSGESAHKVLNMRDFWQIRGALLVHQSGWKIA